MQALQIQEILIHALMKENGAESLLENWKSRKVDEVFPGLFPDRPCREAACLQEYMRGLHTLPRIRDLRLALFFLCFKTKQALAAAQTLTIEEDSKIKILKAIELRDEFYFVSDTYKVKHFLSVHGEDMFAFLQRLSEWQVKLHDHAEIRNEARAEYFKIVKQSNEPIYLHDMAVNADMLREIGLDEQKITRTLNALLDLIHKYPHANKEEILMQKVKNINGTLATKLVKKFFGRY